MLELDTSSPQHSPWRNSTKFLHVRMQKKCGKPWRKLNRALKNLTIRIQKAKTVVKISTHAS